MSLKWPAKDPDASLDYSIDWSRFLGSDSITSVQWYIDDADGVKTAVSASDVVNGLTFVGQSHTTTVALAVFSGGTNNTAYTVTCAITYGASNYVDEREVKLPIREK